MLKCKCGRPAIYFKSYEGRAYCKEHFVRYIERKVKKTIGSNRLVKYGDVISIAVSGGKDSMLMLYLLDKIFRNVRKVKYFALLVDEGIKGYRERSLAVAKKFCKKRGIEYREVKYKDAFGITIDEIYKLRKKHEFLKKEKICTWCAVLKRYLINKTSRKLGATKVAIGHTLNDEAESIIMNFIRGDFDRFIRLGPFPIVLEDKKFVPRIKPLREITTEEVILYNKIKGIPYYHKHCPYATDNVRKDVQAMLKRLEKKYPGTIYQIVRFYDKIKPMILKSVHIKDEFKHCKVCGEPSSRDVCRVCELLEKLRRKK